MMKKQLGAQDDNSPFLFGNQTKPEENLQMGDNIDMLELTNQEPVAKELDQMQKAIHQIDLNITQKQGP
jgi:hypothetical protein